MKSYYKNKKGATSVLVVFMIVVLITLGAFAIVSSNSNYNFSKNVLTWNNEFYKLENTSEVFIATVDDMLISAENQAVDYLMNKEFEKQASNEIPEYIQKDIINTYQQNGEDSLLQVFNKIYFYYAEKNFGEINNIYNQAAVYKEDNDLFTKMIFASDDKNMNLNVLIKVLPVSYDISIEEEKIVGEKNKSSKRFSIIERNQWQEEPIYDDTMEIWDGILE